MNLPVSPDDRPTAFGNQLIETHLRPREDLARLREGAAPGSPDAENLTRGTKL